MDLEAHCRRSLLIFGKRYDEIHRWLDEFAAKYPPSERYKHRKHRHHKEGIEEAKTKFKDLGDIASLIAEDHIRCDNDGQLPSKKDYEIPEYD